MAANSIFEKLSRLFGYPDGEYATRAAGCFNRLALEDSKAAGPFAEFCAGLQGLATEELQELYTRTFDLNPMCTLEVGWQLFGEDYQRGEFLVKMRQQLRAHTLPESQELPDHLTHVLAMLGRLEADEAAEFAAQYLLPALEKMNAAWKEDRNAFASLLTSTFLLVKNRFPAPFASLPVRRPELRVLN
jgi:nitrate reductase delta subunit